MRTLAVAASLLLVACRTTPAPIPDPEALRTQVMEAERAFAQTMVDRDHTAFRNFLAADAVFFSADRPVRGAQAIAEEWKPYFEESTPPFGWTPEQVVVLAEGDLAWSTGPVTDADGNIVAQFNSVWRRDASGGWKVVFDRGTAVCPPAAAPTAG